MCRIETHTHVRCGCTSYTVIVSQCPTMSRVPGIGSLYRKCKQDGTTIKVPAEELPCCSDCYPVVLKGITDRYLNKRNALTKRYEERRCTEERFSAETRKLTEEYETELDLLSRPYRRTLKDAMAYGRLDIEDGGDDDR